MTPPLSQQIVRQSAEFAAQSNWAYDLETTRALLFETQKKLQRAESKLAAQDKRIACLETLATHDSLTKLLNRRGFEQVFEIEQDRLARGLTETGALVLIDLDNFKPINDTYGHGCGDACLRLVGKALKDISRNMDTVARLGGDEFVILMPNANKFSLARRLQEINTMLNSLSLIWNGQEVDIRASIGMKAFTRRDTLEHIYACADRAMYTDKERKKEKEM